MAGPLPGTFDILPDLATTVIDQLLALSIAAVLGQVTYEDIFGFFESGVHVNHKYVREVLEPVIGMSMISLGLLFSYFMGAAISNLLPGLWFNKIGGLVLIAWANVRLLRGALEVPGTTEARAVLVFLLVITFHQVVVSVGHALLEYLIGQIMGFLPF